MSTVLRMGNTYLPRFRPLSPTSSCVARHCRTPRREICIHVFMSLTILFMFRQSHTRARNTLRAGPELSCALRRRVYQSGIPGQRTAGPPAYNPGASTTVSAAPNTLETLREKRTVFSLFCRAFTGYDYAFRSPAPPPLCQSIVELQTASPRKNFWGKPMRNLVFPSILSRNGPGDRNDLPFPKTSPN